MPLPLIPIITTAIASITGGITLTGTAAPIITTGIVAATGAMGIKKGF